MKFRGRVYDTVFEEKSGSVSLQEKNVSSYAFKGMSAGHQYDVKKTGVEGETAGSLHSRDPRNEVVQVFG